MKEKERERGCMFADEESERANGRTVAGRKETKTAAKGGGRDSCRGRRTCAGGKESEREKEGEIG